MKHIKQLLILVVILLGLILWSLPSSAQGSSVDIYTFMDELYDTMRVEHTKYVDKYYNMLVQDNFLMDRESYNRISFLHILMTSSDAVDGNSAGFLYIPYMWHWIEDNPRLQISRDSVLLVDTPASNSAYESAAMVDRVPQIFISDMVSDSPYSHPDYGKFYTFGWCSEREMAFINLLTHWGFEAKLIVQGAHSFTLVKLSEDAYFMVDNTFASMYGYANDIAGDDTGLSKWYNKQAKREVNASVSVVASNRIYTTLRNKYIAYSR